MNQRNNEVLASDLNLTALKALLQAQHCPSLRYTLMLNNATHFTVKKAAEALGVSVRTIRRRIKDGELPATKVLQGKKQVWAIDGAELATYAESTGQQLTIAPADGGPQRTESPEVPHVVQGQAMSGVPAEAALKAEVDRQREALAALETEREFLRRVVENMTRALPEAREQSKTELEGLQATVDAQTTEIARLKAEVSEARRPWWRRVFRGRGEASHD